MTVERVALLTSSRDASAPQHRTISCRHPRTATTHARRANEIRHTQRGGVTVCVPCTLPLSLSPSLPLSLSSTHTLSLSLPLSPLSLSPSLPLSLSPSLPLSPSPLSPPSLPLSLSLSLPLSLSPVPSRAACRRARALTASSSGPASASASALPSLSPKIVVYRPRRKPKWLARTYPHEHEHEPVLFDERGVCGGAPSRAMGNHPRSEGRSAPPKWRVARTLVSRVYVAVCRMPAAARDRRERERRERGGQGVYVNESVRAVVMHDSGGEW